MRGGGATRRAGAPLALLPRADWPGAPGAPGSGLLARPGFTAPGFRPPSVYHGFEFLLVLVCSRVVGWAAVGASESQRPGLTAWILGSYIASTEAAGR